MTRTQSKVFAVLAVAAVIALGLAAPATAADQKAPRGGLQAAIDPATHQLRQPTAAEVAALSAQSMLMTKSAGEPEITSYADGTISAVLTADFLNVWLAAAGADGSLNQICVDGADAATVQPAAAYEEK
jgi:hypothetical protein